MATNIGVEPSEIMAAVAMFMKPADIDNKYSKDFQGIVSFIKEGKRIANGSSVVYSSGTKSKFAKAFNPSNPDFQKAALIGMSAAKSIRNWIPVRSAESGVPISGTTIPNKVYLTGDKWPDAISKFEVNAYGFKAYNSSDIVIQWKNPKGLSLYGVSLKKKPTLVSTDPTLINKAFDSALEGTGKKEIEELDKVKVGIEKARTKYFARVVREAQKVGYLKIANRGKLPSSDEELMKIRLNMPGFAKDPMALINIKGKGTIDLRDPKNQPKVDECKRIFKIREGKSWREFNQGELRNKAISMRAFVNNKIGSKDSIYNVIIPVINEYSKQFAKALLNLVLKSNLYKEIDEHSFAFALITGVGDIDREGNPKPLQVLPAKGLYTVLCGLSALNKSNTKYKMELDDAANKKAVEAAKVFIKLKKGALNILDLQLKYKGNFLNQPQFAATISDGFKGILTEQWGKKCKVY